MRDFQTLRLLVYSFLVVAAGPCLGLQEVSVVTLDVIGSLVRQVSVSIPLVTFVTVCCVWPLSEANLKVYGLKYLFS